MMLRLLELRILTRVKRTKNRKHVKLLNNEGTSRIIIKQKLKPDSETPPHKKHHVLREQSKMSATG